MLTAGILGLGRWGQHCVDSVQDASDSIHFVAGATRTLSKAEAFARAKPSHRGGRGHAVRGERR